MSRGPVPPDTPDREATSAPSDLDRSGCSRRLPTRVTRSNIQSFELANRSTRSFELDSGSEARPLSGGFASWPGFVRLEISGRGVGQVLSGMLPHPLTSGRETSVVLITEGCSLSIRFWCHTTRKQVGRLALTHPDQGRDAKQAWHNRGDRFHHERKPSLWMHLEPVTWLFRGGSR